MKTQQTPLATQAAPALAEVQAAPMVNGFSVTPVTQVVTDTFARLGNVSVGVVCGLMLDPSLWVSDFALAVHQATVDTDADGQTLAYWRNAVSTARGVQKRALLRFDLVLPAVTQLEDWVSTEARNAGYCLSVEDLANFAHGRDSVAKRRASKLAAKAEADKLAAQLEAKRAQVTFDADKAAEEVKAAEAEVAKAKAAEAEAAKLDPVTAATLRTEEEQAAKLAATIAEAAKLAEAAKAEAAKAEAAKAEAAEVVTIEAEAAPVSLVLLTVTDTGTGYSFALSEAATLEDLKAIRNQVAKYIKARNTVTA